VTTKEYIESGTLEAYVLGALTPEEEAQVRADVAKDPELAEELAAIEDALLDLAAANAMVPPAGLEDKIWNALQPAPPVKEKVIPAAQPHFSANAGDGTGDKQYNKTMPLGPSMGRQWRYAALWVVLAGSLAVNAMLWNQNKEQKEQFATQTAKIEEVIGRQSELDKAVDIYHKRADMMADTAIQTVVMRTMVKGHPMAATVYWDKAKGDAWVALDALPEPPKGMQYQLWVIQNGKPVSMGVMPKDMLGPSAVQKVEMKVMEGQAFAVSLEKEGGVPQPTAENIYVLGKS
jgi:anti-sigma-K factor RskA